MQPPESGHAIGGVLFPGGADLRVWLFLFAQDCGLAGGRQPGGDRLRAGVGPCVGEVAGGLHSSQELIELGEGRLRVKLRLNSLEEVEKWVLSMGGHGTVVRPEALRARLAKVGVELVKRYGT